MSEFDLINIRKGLASVVSGKIDLAVYRYGRGNQMDYPCAVIELQEDEASYLTIGSNTFDEVLLLTVYVRSYDRDLAYEELDKYRSPSGGKSIQAAIETDRTLDSAVDDADVGWGELLDNEDDSASQEYACQFPIRVIKTVA